VIDTYDNACVVISSTLDLAVRETAFLPGVPEPQEDYIRAEPTVFVSNVTGTLEDFFVALLPNDARVEHVYWEWQMDDIIRVWIVIPDPDFSLEAPIYDAQMDFMQKFPKFACDFYIIYRFGKTLESIRPQNARRIK
jgi:hypothetical protein